ncbi:MAG TPA: PEP-CTERM sorting domain-containing protein, partial [Bryobacteraceae bacterium]|nr:PEP-CTERM sorting domain-containing protein [Bryobacteraceae bacterium]
MERVSSHLIANARARLRSFILTLAPAIIAAVAPHAAVAGPLVFPPLNQFNLTNIAADGTVTVPPAGSSFMLVGGNTGSGLPGETDFTFTSDSSGLVVFDWLYNSLDDPGFDGAGYLIDTMYFPFADADQQFGTSSFSVAAGQTYGWWVYTVDNAGEPGILNVSFDPVAQTPEPASIVLALSALVLIAAVRIRRDVRPQFAGFRAIVSVAAALAVAAGSGAAQVQNHYTPVNITGQLALVRMVNASQLAAAASPAFAARLAFSRTAAAPQGPEISKLPSFFPRPQPFRPAFTTGPFSASRVFGADTREARASGPRFSAASLPVTPAGSDSGFSGLSHYDQRNANSGNQFSVEPPNPSIAVANGFVLEGVNNAVRVFSETGAPLLPALASNQLFGVAPAIDRNTGINGVYPTDMRVYFDHDINRWFVLQRSQDNDVAGNPLSESHLYIAVSQGTDPTGVWNIYVLDTTHASNPGCPCIADFPQIGSDQYGFYVSANEYDALYL